MSEHLKELFVKSFDPMVKHEYQAQGFSLRNTLQTRNNVVGSSATFNLMGQGMAYEAADRDEVRTLNPDYSRKEAYLKQYYAAEYTGSLESVCTNIDERAGLAKCIGGAIGRRADQLIIDAAVASTTTNVIVDSGANMTYLKFLEAMEMLDDSGVPVRSGRRFCLLSPKAQTALLKEDEFISNLYINNGILNKPGRIDGQTIGDVTFIVIPSMAEGGLPKAGNIRTLFMWHEYALGVAIGKDFTTGVYQVPNKTVEWLIKAYYIAGATEIDKKGIVKIAIDETK
jgi:hypothetical protein